MYFFNTSGEKATQARIRCSKVEVIAPHITLSLSRTGWPLWNIHFWNGNRLFPF